MLLCKKFTKNQLLFTKDIVIKNKRYRSIFQTEIDPFTEFRLKIFLHGHILIHLSYNRQLRYFINFTPTGSESRKKNTEVLSKYNT